MTIDISRRTALLSMAAIGLTACAKTKPTTSPTAGAPKRGGTLKVAFIGEGATETLNPHETTNWIDGSRSKAMFDKLVDFDSSLRAVPRLATQWESDSTLTTWRISLREATFHNGQPIKSADVLDTIAAIVKNPKASAAKSLGIVNLAASKAADDRTLQLSLHQPYAELIDLFAEYGTQIFPNGQFNPTRPIGSGPFTFESFTPGKSTTLQRYDNYWDTPAHLDAVEYLIANDETARANAVASGQVHFAHEMSPTTLRTLANNPKVQVVSYPRSLHRSFSMKCDRPPFNDPRVRQAFKLMIQREHLQRTVLEGKGTLGNDLFGGPGQQFYATDIAQRTPDLDRAKALLKEAGAQSLSVDLDVTDGVPGMKEAAMVLAQQAQHIGVTVRVNVLPVDNFWSHTKSNSAFSGYGGGAMTIGSHFRTRVLADGRNNYPKWHEPQLTALFQQAQVTKDETARGEIYRQMQRIHHEHGGHIIWALGDMNAVAAQNLRGLDTAAPSNTLNWARFDTVWLA